MNRIGAEGKACTEPAITTTIPVERRAEDFMKVEMLPFSILEAEHRELVVYCPGWGVARQAHTRSSFVFVLALSVLMCV